MGVAAVVTSNGLARKGPVNPVLLMEIAKNICSDAICARCPRDSGEMVVRFGLMQSWESLQCLDLFMGALLVNGIVDRA